MNTPLFWLSLNILTIVILAFYSMMEMACVSFNKVRLQYYVSKGVTRAKWLDFLLKHPSRLFGTTLIGVNVAMVVGSECARRFHIALGLSPDLAPLSQVIIVVIFGELAPMFAARRYAENMAMLGIPLIYASAKVMTPLTWSIGAIARLANKIAGGRPNDSNIFINREELQKVLEEQDEEHPFQGQKEDFNVIVSNIFKLREKEAVRMMEPLNSVQMLPSNSTVAQMQKLIQESPQTFVPIYHQTIQNIVAIATPRDLIRAPDNRKIRDYARPPWFITRNTKATQIINQFRSNKQRVAIVLDDKGHAIGILSLDDLIEEIFGEYNRYRRQIEKPRKLLIDRTFSGEMRIADFNAKFGAKIDAKGNETLAELVSQEIGHHPEVGESIFIDPYEITVKETSLLEIKSVNIRTRVL
jgi:putative hemolysin